MSAPSKTCPMSAWMAAGPVTWTSTPSGASSRSWSRSSSTLSMLSVLEVGDDRDGDDRRGRVLGHHDGGLLPLAATGRSALGPALGPVRPPPAGAVRCALRCALSVGLLGGLRQQGGPLLGQLVLGRLVELAGLGGPQHDGDLALVVGQLLLELDRQGAVGADGQRVQGASSRARPPARTRSRRARGGSARARRTRPDGVRRSPGRARGCGGKARRLLEEIAREGDC